MERTPAKKIEMKQINSDLNTFKSDELCVYDVQWSESNEIG